MSVRKFLVSAEYMKQSTKTSAFIDPVEQSLYDLLETYVVLKYFYITQVLCLFSVPMKNKNSMSKSMQG